MNRVHLRCAYALVFFLPFFPLFSCENAPELEELFFPLEEELLLDTDADEEDIFPFSSAGCTRPFRTICCQWHHLWGSE